MSDPQRAAEKSSKGRIRVAIYQPRMAGGGAQRVTLSILNNLDRERFEPILILRKRGGELAEDVSPSISVYWLDSRVRSAWLKLAHLLRKISPDATLSISTMGNLTVCLGHFVSRIHSPLVVVEQNTMSRTWSSIRRRIVGLVKHTLYRQADRVVAVSQGVADDLMRSSRIREERLIVIYNPVDEEDLYRRSEQPVAHPWLGEDVPVILAAGRLVPQKDFPMLLESFRRLRQKRTARLIIMGEGELREELENLAEKLGISDDVALPGFIDNAPSYMRRSTVFALSSRYEGMPVALIEAMACGVPVVSTDCPSGPSEIITNGKDGILVPVGDAESMADALRLLLDNAQLRESLRNAGFNRAKDFSVKEIVAEYEKLLESLAEE